MSREEVEELESICNEINFEVVYTHNYDWGFVLGLPNSNVDGLPSSKNKFVVRMQEICGDKNFECDKIEGILWFDCDGIKIIGLVSMIVSLEYAKEKIKVQNEGKRENRWESGVLVRRD